MMTMPNPSLPHQSRKTKTWREGLSHLLPEFDNFLEQISDDLGLNDYWRDADGFFQHRIEVRADLKREVYVDRKRCNVVIDNELVRDVAELVLQSRTNPTPEAFEALLLKNLCDTLLGAAAFPVSSHLLDRASLGKRRIAARAPGARAIAYEGYIRLLKEIEVAVSTILAVHEIGHLIGVTGGADTPHDFNDHALEELSCDALATDLLARFHDRFDGAEYDPVEGDIDVYEGFPVTIGAYEFTMSAALLSLEIGELARSLLGDRYDPEHYRTHWNLAKRRARRCGTEMETALPRFANDPRPETRAALAALQLAAEAVRHALIDQQAAISKAADDIDPTIDRALIVRQREELAVLHRQSVKEMGLAIWEGLLLPKDVADQCAALSAPVAMTEHKFREPIMPPPVVIDEKLRRKIAAHVRRIVKPD